MANVVTLVLTNAAGSTVEVTVAEARTIAQNVCRELNDYAEVNVPTAVGYVITTATSA
jgi:hypothetical protein